MRELQEFLAARRIYYGDCFERGELVERAEQALRATTALPTRAPPAPAEASPFEGFGEVVALGPESPSADGPASLIFLHGFGDTARGFVSMLPGLLRLPEVRYVLPSATSSGISTWFGLGGGMERSIDYIHHLIRLEIGRGVPAGRIFVAGFSQGGCVAVRAALSFPDAGLGGCVAASTFLGDGRLSVSAANSGLKVLGVHGEADPVVPVSQGRQLVAALRGEGVDAGFLSYPGLSHMYNEDEARDVSSFLRQRLAPEVDEARLRASSARELLAFLRTRGVDTAGYFDKEGLLRLALGTISA